MYENYVVDMISNNPSFAQGDIEIVANSWNPTQVNPNTPFTLSYQIHNKSTTNSWEVWGYYLDENGQQRDSWDSTTYLLPPNTDYTVTGTYQHPGIAAPISMTIYVGHVEAGTITCYQCQNGTDVSQDFTGDTCPNGWYPVPQSCGTPPPVDYRWIMIGGAVVGVVIIGAVMLSKGGKGRRKK